MKSLLLVLPLLATACHSVQIPTQYGTAKVFSFGQKVRIADMTYKDGSLRLKGYNNDQVAGMVALFEAGIEAGKKSVVP